MSRMAISLGAALLTIACDAALAQAPVQAVQQPPLTQPAFIKIIETFKQSYRQASTEIQRTNLRTLRAEQLCRYGTYGIVNWTGRVMEVKSTNDGKAGVFIATDNFFLSPSDYISKVEPIYPAILSLNRGDRVVFHGQLHRGSSDCYKQLKMWEAGAMEGPNFEFDITAVAKY